MTKKLTRTETLAKAIVRPGFTRAFALQLDHGWFRGCDTRGRVQRAMALAHAALWETLVEPTLIRAARTLLEKGVRFELIAVAPFIGYKPITQDLLDLLPPAASQRRAAAS